MSFVAADIEAKFSADTASMDAGLRRITEEADDMKSHVEEAGESFGGLGVVATVAAGIVVAKVHEMIHVTEEWVGMVEQAEIQFGALMGSSDKGKAMVTMLEDLAIKLGTPVQAMLDGSRNMEKFTQGVHGGAEDMKMMADVAAGTGQSITDLSNTVGRYYSMLARGQGSGGGRLGIQLGLSPDQINQLAAQAKAGLDPEKIYGTLMSDLEARYAGAGEKLATGTMKGIRETFTGLKDQSIGTAFEPLMKGVEEFMNHVNKGLASEGFKRFIADVRDHMESLAGSMSSIGDRVDHFFERFEGHNLNKFLDTVHQIAPALGAIAGVLSGLSLGTLEHLPIIGQALAPLAGILTPATAGILGFLLATKDTREALFGLVGAVVELVRNVVESTSGVAALVSELAPVAALFLNLTTSVVKFVATNEPMLNLVKTALEVFAAFKLFEALHQVFEVVQQRVVAMAIAHAQTSDAANVQENSEQNLVTALEAEAAAAEQAAGANDALAASHQRAASTAEQLSFAGMGAPAGTPGKGGGSWFENLGGTKSMLVAGGAGAAGVGLSVAGSFVGGDAGGAMSAGGSALAGAGMGAMMGSMMGPWGTVIGGVVGGVAGLTQGLLSLSSAAARAAAETKAFVDELAKTTLAKFPAQNSDVDSLRNRAADLKDKVQSDIDTYGKGQVGLLAVNQDNKNFKPTGVGKEILADIKAYQAATEDAAAADKLLARMSEDTGIPLDELAKRAKALGKDLTGIDPTSRTGAAALKALEDELGSTAAAAQAAADAINRIKSAAANVKQDIAGALGQNTVNLGASPEFDVVQKKLAEIGSGGTELAGLANKLHAQGAAYAATTHQTTDYINEQKHAFDTANANADRSYAITQAHIAHQHALEGLTKAQEHYTDAVRAQTRATISEVDNENNVAMALARRSNQHFELHAQLIDLSAAHAAYGTLVEEQISILNSDQDAVDGLQRQYQSLQDELTQTEDAMKSLQAIINQPLSGEGAMKDQIQANKVAQGQVQEQMSALTMKGVPSGSPEMVALQAELNKLQAESQHLAAINTVTFDNQHYQIDRASKDLREQSFQTQIQGATTLGTLAARAHDVTANMDEMKGPLDQANARLRDQKTYTDQLASAVGGLVGADQAVITTSRGVRDSLEGVHQAGEAVAASVRSIAVAQRAVTSAAFDASLYMNSFMDSTLAKAEALITRYQQLIALEAQAGKTAWDAATIFNSVFGNVTGQAIINANTPGTREYGLTHLLHAADGAFIKHFASGGMESHFAQIARQGSPTRMWNEPETGGEAYIPLDPSKRSGALDVLSQVMGEFGVGGGGGSVSIADGAVQVHIEVAGNAPDGLGDEVYAAVDGALQHLVATVTAHGGKGTN